MKFELKPPNQQITDNELIADLINVANKLNKNSLKQREYSKNNGANFSYQTLTKRFGNWENALIKAGLKTEKSILGVEYGEISIRENLLIEDLIRVSEKLNKKELTFEEYMENGNYSVSCPYSMIAWKPFFQTA